MTVFIHDASILLDLIHTDIIKLFMTIPARMVTTDFVVEEVTDPADRKKLEATISSDALQVMISGLAELDSIVTLQSACRALSIAECSLLFYAGSLQAVVLTGDNRLRREATQSGLEVHGTVWVFDELVTHVLLSQKEAADKLENLLSVNPRLPREECERMINRWRK